MIIKQKQLMVLVIIWSLGPLIWQLYTSFSTPEALIEPFNIEQNRWTFNNYRLILNSNPPFWIYILNSTILGISTTILTLILAIPASYSLARIPKKAETPFRLGLFLVTLFPYVLLFLSLLETARFLHLGNNLLALSLPYAALSLPFCILLLSSALKDISIELEEAAKIEGLILWQRLRFVLLPILWPAISSTSILIFIFSWNEYPIALTWISKTNLLTLPVAMARIAGSSVYSIPYGLYAAATVLGSIPMLILVLLFQKKIVSGLTQGAIKG